MRLAWQEGQNPRVRQENITNRSAPQSGHRMRAALRSPHETATDHEGEPAFRIAAVKILLDHLLNDRSENPYSRSKRLSYSVRNLSK